MPENQLIHSWHPSFKRKQINGSSGSIMNNIAEGFERGGNAEFIQFLKLLTAQQMKCNHSCTEFRQPLFT